MLAPETSAPVRTGPLRTGVEVWADPTGAVSVALGQIVRPVPQLRHDADTTDDDRLRAGLAALDLLAADACRDCGRAHEPWAELGSAARRVSAHTRSLIGGAAAVRTNAPWLASDLEELLGDFVGAPVTVIAGTEEATAQDVLFLDADARPPAGDLPPEAVVVAFRARGDAVLCAAPTALRAAPCVACVVDALHESPSPRPTVGDERAAAPLVAAALATALHRLELGALANGVVLRLDLVTGLLTSEVLRSRDACTRCRGVGRDAIGSPALAYEERIASPYGFDVGGLLSPPLRATEDAPPPSPQRPRLRVTGGRVAESPLFPTAARPRALDSMVRIADDLFGSADGVHRGVPSAGGLRATTCYVVAVVGGVCHTFAPEGGSDDGALALVRTPFELDAPDGVALAAVVDIDALLPKYAGNAPRLAALELGMCLALLHDAVGAAHPVERFEALRAWEALVSALPRRRLAAGVFVPTAPGGVSA